MKAESAERSAESNSTDRNQDSSEKTPTNKLTVYLIKDGIKEGYVAERAERYKTYGEIDGELYKAKSFVKKPNFMDRFFHIVDDTIFSSSAQVLLILKT